MGEEEMKAGRLKKKKVRGEEGRERDEEAK